MLKIYIGNKNLCNAIASDIISWVFFLNRNAIKYKGSLNKKLKEICRFWLDALFCPKQKNKLYCRQTSSTIRKIKLCQNKRFYCSAQTSCLCFFGSVVIQTLIATIVSALLLFGK